MLLLREAFDALVIMTPDERPSIGVPGGRDEEVAEW
jgi:hypothetical protein